MKGFHLLLAELIPLNPEEPTSLQAPPNYFSEQTIINLTIKRNHGIALPQDKYIMNVDDQFIYPDKFATKQIVMRHYVSDIRHKFWINMTKAFK